MMPEADMKRRDFFFMTLAGTAAFTTTNGYALQFYPREAKKKWAVLFGSRYGTARDAAVWISEGMGGIAQVFDARENPDLNGYNHIIVGSGIYGGKAAPVLQDYLARSGEALAKKIRALFACWGAGDNTPKPYIAVMQSLCQVEPLVSQSFPGRITRILYEPAVSKSLEEFFKSQNRPWGDSDRLVRKDCLTFGKEILEVVEKAKL